MEQLSDNFATNLPAGLGPIKQICFVCSDIPASVAFWTRSMGVGPFFQTQHVDLQNTKYLGKPADVQLSLALAYWGDLQIELIRQTNVAPSIFTQWNQKGRTGIHHVLVETEDVVKTRTDLAQVGWSVALEARVGLDGDCIYFDTGSDDIPFLEVVRLPPRFASLFAYMKNAATNWDGSKPLRDFPPENEWLPIGS
jgi:methylmalonyl-CoA/ethylmalonyl-CoA epimerase